MNLNIIKNLQDSDTSVRNLVESASNTQIYVRNLENSYSYANFGASD